ncbi:MAG: lysozyme [Cellulosilyticaceae bacterium]
MFKISKVGVDLIKSFEGCYLKSYRCPARVWTIGWGTTEPIGGREICEGMVITQQQADQLLINNLKAYENAVNKYVTYPINQNQFDALVSFAYNCGCGALQKSTLLQYLNQGRIQAAANQFDVWNRGGGKVLQGLVRRRAAEKKIFLTPTRLSATAPAKPVVIPKKEEYKVEKTKLELNGKVKEVETINLKGNNYVKLRDLQCDKILVDYSNSKKMAVVKTI